MSHIKYRADIDGLRAVAVVPVVLFHCGLAVMSGGYVGVDVFFVISGYLITSGIQKDLLAGRFSIAEFYVRRIRRILPALVATVAISCLAAIILLDRASLVDFYKSVVATSLFSSNIFFWRASGYFEPSALTKPLLHTWSLAVEEQFYIIMPVAMGLFWRLAPKLLKPAMALVFVLSLAGSIAAINVAPTASFFLLPTRAWELLAGAMIAFFQIKTLPRILREALGAMGLALIVAAVFLFDEATPFPGVAALAPVAGAVFIILAGVSDGSFVSRALAWRPMVWIGLISYSLYLVHWPLIVFTRYALLRDPEGWEIAALVVGSVILAVISWRFVERPFRRPKQPGKRLGLFVGAVVTLCALATTGLAGAAYTRATTPGDDGSASRAETNSNSWLGGRCFLMNQPAEAWAEEVCIRTFANKPRAVLWGDSFAAQYIPGIIENQARLDHDVVQYTYAGCPPILSYASYARPHCQDFNAKIFDVIDRYDADAVVIAARWDQLRSRGLTGLAPTIAALKARGVKVYVIGQSPMFAFDVAVLDDRKAGQTADGQSGEWMTTFKPGEFEAVEQNAAQAQFIDPSPAFCSNGLCRYKANGVPLFFDYGHLSDVGSAYAVRSYFPFLIH